LQPERKAVLDHPVVAMGDVATAQVVALENHGRLSEVKTFFHTTLKVIPGHDAQVGTVTGVLCGAVVVALTMLEYYL
jgi:hypothetical protein